jgi:purine nucleosidase
MRDVILDMDMGIDDAIAVLYLTTVADVRIEAAGSVHGNVDADGAARNLLRVLELCGVDAPVAIGARRPLVRDLHLAPEVHGDDGLGNVAPAPARRGPSSESAPEQLVRLARTNPGRFDLLATGPLTNLAMALVLEPQLPQLVRSVTIMGGAASGVGNMTPVAEANLRHDPEAAGLVFAAPWDLTMVGLDVTMATRLEEPEIARLARSSATKAQFATAALAHYLDFYEMISGRRVCPLHDPLAAGILADSSLIRRSLEAEIVVGTGSETRGMTIVDRRRGGGPVETASPVAHRIVMGVDGPRFVEELLTRLGA